MKRVALIGCGALGAVIAGGIAKLLSDQWTLCGVLGRSPEKTQAFAEKFGARAYLDRAGLIADRPDIVVEAAGGGAVREHAEEILAAGIPMALLGIGALADENLRTRLTAAAQRSGAVLHLSSGAIGGFDAMHSMSIAARLAGKDPAEALAVRITNAKAPRSLAGAPGIAGRQLPDDHAEVIFEGSAREAIAGFPKNVNVAVAAALATAGVEASRVAITSDPSLTANCHGIHVQGCGVETDLRFKLDPDPANPRSSTMAAWSVLALLETLASPVRAF